jgi:hypothetical protein
MRFGLGLASVLGLSACAFSRATIVPPLPPVSPAVESAGLSVFVSDSFAPSLTWKDECTEKVLARLPGALRRALLQAGFEVVTDAAQPAQLSTTVTAELSIKTCAGPISGTTTMVVRSQDKILDQIEIAVPPPGRPAGGGGEYAMPSALYPSYVGNILADQLGRSARVSAFAASLKSGTPPPPMKLEGKGAVVAVFNIEDAGRQLDAKVAEQLTEYLSTKIAEVMHFRVVPRDQIRTRLDDEKASSYKACFSEECQIELGKAVAAQKSLATKLLRVGNSCALTSTLYDLKSETTEQAASARTECSDNALMNGVDQVVQQLRVASGK